MSLVLCLWIIGLIMDYWTQKIIGEILSKKCCHKWGVAEKKIKGEWLHKVGVYRRGINPLMTALLRNCLIFLKFCVLDNFRLTISWGKNEVCSIVEMHIFWPSHICDTGHISIQSCNNMLYLYTKFWLVLTQDMFFMFCMIYLVCSLVTHIYDKGHIGFNIW